MKTLDLAPDLEQVVRRLLSLASPAGGLHIDAAAEEVRALHAGGTTELSTGPEAVCREFAQQFVFSVSAVTAEDVDRLRDALGSDLAVYEFVSALWVLDLAGRVESATQQVIGR